MENTLTAKSFDLMEVRKSIEAELSNAKFGNRPPELYDPISYILSIGGKRMRPVLVLLAANVYDNQWQKYLRPAVGVEVFHNFTLMHDDIMDKAPLRRGKQTVHEKWNDHIALLAGDAMLIKTYDFFDGIPDAQYKSAIRMYNRCAVEVCEGQQLDMNFETRDNVTVEEYIEMISLKTAALLGFGLGFGAFLAGAKTSDVHHMSQMGIGLGIGFQLKDDLLDVFADQEKFGKQVGGDIISNKKTYLLLKAFAKANPTQKAELEHWISLQEFDAEQKVDAVKAIYHELNIATETEQLINTYFDRAFGELAQLDADPMKKEFLKGFFNEILQRDK
jgi:geranylgeranyl diphosphate synthase type II